MAKKTWKYAKEKPAFTGRFIKLVDNEPKELTITDWDFSKSTGGYLFKCYVNSEDGEESDKIWTVWEYDLMMLLKKKLAGKKVHIPMTVKVLINRKSKDEEPEYEVSLI